jgi:hypothetical protein
MLSNAAHRGIEIEHRFWGLTGADWLSGFFSRQYKEPIGSDSENRLPRRLNPDRPILGWSTRPMSVRLSRFISHSMGLDLLYAGTGAFWVGAAIFFIAIFFLRR